MKDHVPSFEICQKLKDAGFPQESEFWYEKWGYDPTITLKHKKECMHAKSSRISAPLLSEILEEIVPAISWSMQREINGDYFIYNIGEDYILGISGQNKNASEAAALFWLKLNKKEGKNEQV